jgi:predicted nucleic acid-binding protein
MTVTLDTNIFIDKAELRAGAKNFDRILELAREEMLSLWYTSTTDFEINHPGALRIITKLVQERVLHEDPNTGTGRDYMPGGPALHRVEEAQIEKLTEEIWPNANVLGLSYESKKRDACHLLAHKLNKRDIFLTRDRDILAKRPTIKKILEISILNPEELLLTLTSVQTQPYNFTMP